MHGSDRERVRTEAADWCVRINRSDREEHNPEFERWLSEGPLNRQLFSEMSELYNFGAGLSQKPGVPVVPDHRPTGGTRIKIAVLMLAATGLTVAAAAAIISTFRENLPILQSANDEGMVALAAAAEKRTFRLADGSSVILDARSLLTVSMDGRSRLLRLEKGRARFEVEHDGRPFIVSAGNGSVRALGTIFDVSFLDDQSVRVDLLHGAVEVKANPRTASGMRESRTRLVAGQSTEFRATGSLAPPVVGGMTSAKLWTEGLATFNGEPLIDVVDQANRYSRDNFSLKVEDRGTARRPVFGTLKIDDPRQLARVLARSLDLAARETSDGITLYPK